MRVTIRVQPGAARPGVGGSWADPQAGTALVVRVAERAVDGRATEAALRALADALGLRRADLRLARGATSRLKSVEVTPDPADEPALRTRIDRLLGGAGSEPR
ncbi:DUF167 domain-containing protein [Frankia sp. AgB32]|uniref:DUF167 domain-containing protein n=1 Tax=Frankia sp. AgB32 TaxID=631119 RepID=UPI00200EBB83|nr:DUF167 domain-containing protein [Frankia sp. AgB32]MCK9894852.1 DUF167 domain-containing protein [Frankia sp. AgB32]